MFSWEWESFQGLVNGGSFEIVDVGPLRTSIRRFSFNRDEKLQLTIETCADGNAKSNATIHPPGTVRVNTDAVRLSDEAGSSIIAEGVQSRECITRTTAEAPAGELRHTATVQMLKGVIRPDRQASKVIDWLANVHDPFIWPDVIDDEQELRKTRTFGHGPVLKGSAKASGSARRAVTISVDGHEITVCALGVDKIAGVNKPGFILYSGNPSDDFRKKVRYCISFSLGIFLVYLGCSSFCEDSSLISFEAVSPYSLGGRAYEIPATPPAPLGARYEWEIDRGVLSRMVNALHSQYEALDFGNLSWAYWHAVCATPHIAGVHYGAAIEALQRSYLDANAQRVEKRVLGEDDWNSLKTSVQSVIAALAAEDDAKTILKNKLNQMNSLPESLVTERLLQDLQIELGDREKRAWKERNIAAHGSATDPEEYVDLIKNIKLLRLRFHRMMFSMTMAADVYYDYFSIGRPTRKVTEAVPD
jgi:hypothetical protein